MSEPQCKTCGDTGMEYREANAGRWWGECPDCDQEPAPRPRRTSAELIALLDDPKIAAAVNEKGGGRHS